MRNIIIILGFLILSIVSYGQSISGPTSVTGGKEYTYTYTSKTAGTELGTLCTTTITKGRLTSTNIKGSISLPPGEKSVTFKVKWDNETTTGKISLTVVISGEGADLKNITITKDNTCYPTSVNGQKITSNKTYTGCAVEIVNSSIANNATVSITGDRYVSIKPSFSVAKGSYVTIKTNNTAVKSTVALPDNLDVPQIDKARLEQNSPNPFNGSTAISYFIPEKSKNAYLQILDLSGRMIDKIEITEKGDGQIILDSGRFKPNTIYLYCLSVDGVIIDTKKFYIK